MSNEELIKNLRVKAQTVKELSDFWDEFFDISETTHLIRNSEQVKHKPLQDIIEAVCQKILKKKVVKPKIIMTRLEGTDFYHGGVNMMDRIGNFAYFKDIDLGMLALASPVHGETKIARFSIIYSAKDTKGIIPPLGKERYTLH